MNEETKCFDTAFLFYFKHNNRGYPYTVSLRASMLGSVKCCPPTFCGFCPPLVSQPLGCHSRACDAAIDACEARRRRVAAGRLLDELW